MTTVSAVLAWRPNDLDESARQFGLAKEQVERVGEHVEAQRKRLTDFWGGESGRAASDALDDPLRDAVDLVEALDLVARTLSAASEALSAAQGLVRRGNDMAADSGLVMLEDGRVPRPTPVLLPKGVTESTTAANRRRRKTETAEDAETLAVEGLAAADEGDRDAASAVRRAWGVAVAQSGPHVGSNLVAAVLERRVPAPGTDPATVSAWWQSLSPSARAALEEKQWVRLGNLDGIPYDVRVRANRVAINAAIEDEARRASRLESSIAELERTLAELQASERPDGFTLFRIAEVQRELANARSELADCEALGRWYHELLTETITIELSDSSKLRTGHHVVLFDPAGGRFAEVIGDLSTASSVGIYVPGTGSAFGKDTGRYDRAASFVAGADPAGSLAMISFLGGPMPLTLSNAPSNHYATAAGPVLARFVAGIDAKSGASVTVLGHSYGGAVVGMAEVSGMRADRIVHVASAGMGTGVFAPTDLPYPATPRYSLTAPGDLIGVTQGVNVDELGALGHGADPDSFPGVIRLETGRVDNADANSPLVQGMGAHSGVFHIDSTSWKNMLAVLEGGAPITLYTEPVQARTPQGLSVGTQYPMADPDFVPPSGWVE